MAKVTITIEDEGNSVNISAKFKPALEVKGPATIAQGVAAHLLTEAQEYFRSAKRKPSKKKARK